MLRLFHKHAAHLYPHDVYVRARDPQLVCECKTRSVVEAKSNSYQPGLTASKQPSEATKAPNHLEGGNCWSKQNNEQLMADVFATEHFYRESLLV